MIGQEPIKDIMLPINVEALRVIAPGSAKARIVGDQAKAVEEPVKIVGGLKVAEVAVGIADNLIDDG